MLINGVSWDSVFVYTLPFQVVGGSVQIFEAVHGAVGDFIHFEYMDNVARLAFLSFNVSHTSLADVNFLPGQENPNVVGMEENGMMQYVPFYGYYPGSNGDPLLEYHFYSDAPVPEPGTLSLMLVGLALAGIKTLRRR